MYLIRPMSVTDAVLTSSNVPETDFSAWASGTTYALNDKAISTTTHRIYQSAVGSNVGHDPTTDDGTHWTDIGPTNKWAMFDQKVGTQTSNSTSIDVTLRLTSSVDSVALLNTSAETVRIVMTDDTAGVVYDQTFELTDLTGLTDVYSWCFDPVVLSSVLVTNVLPKYGSSATVRVVISGSAAMCGACVVGLSKQIGAVQYGAQIGIQDYSVKSTDLFGDYEIVERDFTDTAQFDVWISSGNVDAVKKMLAAYRATPIVYVGTEAYESTTVFGFYKNFQTVISYPDYSVCTIELEGLT